MEETQAYEITLLSVCLIYQLLNQLTDAYETWYERYVIACHHNLILRNLLQPLITS
jgi:hypothetical protein